MPCQNKLEIYHVLFPSFKYQLDKYLSTIPDTPCIANYDNHNCLENSSDTNPHHLTGVHPV